MNLLGMLGYPLFLVAASEIFLGFILLKKNPRNSPVNKSVAALSFFMALWCIFAGTVYVRASIGLDYDLCYRACWVGWLGIPAAFQMIYHMQDGKSRNMRMAGFILYPLWLIIFILCFSTDLMETGAYSLIPFHKRYGPLETQTRFFGVILLGWIVYELSRLRKGRVSIKKAQLDYFLAGCIILAASAILVSGVLLRYRVLVVDPALGSYLSLPWVALTYYSISRHRLFDIQIAISRTLTVTLLLASAAAIHIGLFKLLEPATGPTPAILISLSVIAFLVFGTPLRKKIDGLIGNAVMKDKYEYQEILRESVRAATTIQDLNELLNYIAVVTQKSLQAQKVCLFVKGGDGQYHIRSSRGLDQRTTDEYRIKDGMINWLMLTRQTFVKEEQELARKPDDFLSIYQDMDNIGAELVIPMFYQGNLLGMLTIGRKGNKEMYFQSDIDLLESFAGQTAVALENARLSEEAITDGLTGLYGHKHFKTRLQEEIERAKRYHHPLSLLIIDIDYFKQINDRHGHLAGDRILRELSIAWKEKIRLGDVLARYGGEEFAVILPETPELDALKTAEYLRAHTEGLEIGGIRVTISAGVGFFDGRDRDTDCEALINLADQALYRAKQAGRNRVTLA